MKLSCIDQSTADGDCYVLAAANVSGIWKFMTHNCVESDAVWITFETKQFAEVFASLFRLCGRLSWAEERIVAQSREEIENWR